VEALAIHPRNGQHRRRSSLGSLVECPLVAGSGSRPPQGSQWAESVNATVAGQFIPAQLSKSASTRIGWRCSRPGRADQPPRVSCSSPAKSPR
jgi:hypothetical protein